jgi:hypothetical protein
MLHLAEAIVRPTLCQARIIGFRRDGTPIWEIAGGATGVAMSNDLENKLLDHVLGGPDYTRVATTHIALFTADPGETFAGTEVTGGSYARVAYTNNATNWPAASGGSKSNANVIDFGTATANWGTITHVVIASALTAGVALFYGALTASKTVNNGDGFKFLGGTPGKIVVAFD